MKEVLVPNQHRIYEGRPRAKHRIYEERTRS